jgi:hypothetical protein
MENTIMYTGLTRRAKDWNQSKTIIINSVLFVLGLVTLLATLIASPEMHMLGISPEIARYASITLLIVNVVNLYLRGQTTMPVRMPGQKRPE